VTWQERVSGYQAAMREAGLDVPQGYVMAGNYMAESGVAAVQALWSGPQRPDAIIAANAKVVRGVLDELVTRGCRIPEDVAVSAIDDPFPQSKFGPRLTVVEQPGYEMGKKAVELLLTRLPPSSSDEPAREIVFASVLRPGTTCGELEGAAVATDRR
jgi:LacI family transcriptional regulator, galactose operon repressor